jgi:hypothetical protein
MAKEKERLKGDFAFGRTNYIIMLSGIGLILFGFILMTGGGSTNPNIFSDDIFSTRRITVAPLLVLSGFILEIYAIVKKAKD